MLIVVHMPGGQYFERRLFQSFTSLSVRFQRSHCLRCNRMMLQASRLCSVCGWRFFNVAADVQCPRCGKVDFPAVPVLSHWWPLHRYPVDHAHNWQPEAACEFYEEWCTGIPSIACSCRANWAEYTSSNPPAYESAMAFFVWSVQAHNYVSEHHANKPTITVEEAFTIHWPVTRPLGA